jgi:hypothetical protein
MATEAENLAAVTQDGTAIEYIKNPSDSVRLFSKMLM